MPVAERMYARALLQAAKEEGRVEQVREDLADFVETARQVPELQEVLRSPQINPRARADAVEAVLAGSDELVRNFVKLVAERGRAGSLEQMLRELDRLIAEEAGQIEVEVTTAYELSDEEFRRIVELIEARSGKKVEATRRVDPDLIGGVVLQAGSLRLDASVSGRLERLRRELATAAT